LNLEGESVSSSSLIEPIIDVLSSEMTKITKYCQKI